MDQRVADLVPYHSVSVGGKTTDTVIRGGGFAQPDAADLKEIVIAVIVYCERSFKPAHRRPGSGKVRRIRKGGR